MTTFQVACFILLWIVIGAEGVLLMLLYRHVEISYARRRGLGVGTQAPSLTIRDTQGRPRGLSELLAADYTLLVFGSPGCAGCRALLSDHDVRRFLSTRGILGYFLAQRSDLHEDHVVDPSLEIVTVEQRAFNVYAIDETPFAYIVTRTGTIVARGSVGEGLHRLVRLCDSVNQRDRGAAQIPIQVAPMNRSSR